MLNKNIQTSNSEHKLVTSPTKSNISNISKASQSRIYLNSQVLKTVCSTIAITCTCQMKLVYYKQTYFV